MATSKTATYAWTDIVTAGDDEGSRKVIKAGESVSESDFSEEDWAQLVEARSVRTRPFPDMPANFGGSPREFMVQQTMQQLQDAEDMLGDEDLIVEANQAVDTGMTGEEPPDSPAAKDNK